MDSAPFVVVLAAALLAFAAIIFREIAVFRSFRRMRALVEALTQQLEASDAGAPVPCSLHEGPGTEYAELLERDPAREGVYLAPAPVLDIRVA